MMNVTENHAENFRHLRLCDVPHAVYLYPSKRDNRWAFSLVTKPNARLLGHYTRTIDPRQLAEDANWLIEQAVGIFGAKAA